MKNLNETPDLIIACAKLVIKSVSEMGGQEGGYLANVDGS